tara:strand:+ start:629 stop:880 length:252 start_codon:yes stop_codon:yes gene_type:complete
VTYNPNKPPEDLIRLLDIAPKISTKDGFIHEYLERLSDYETTGDAYWSVENDHMSVFGRTRYNGHENFSSVLSRWNSKRRGKL